MPLLYFITHPDVLIDPAVPVTEWPLSPRGQQRMEQALALPWMANIGTIWCSTERKARDGADILAARVGVPVRLLAALGENDRSATGYLPRAAFEATADLFFAHPGRSIRGWERAVDAQRRIIGAVAAVAAASGPGDIAVVAHGGVGALLLCHLLGERIDRRHDQPGGDGGNFFAFEAGSSRLLHGWRPIDR